MNKLKIEYLPVEAIKPYENNTRKHGKEDVAEIKKSIEKYSFSDPIGVWGDENLIVEGHGRLMAAKELGMKEVPTIRLDHLTDEERREYAIMHNRTAELSEWDFEKLKAEMAELHMEDFDFQIDGLDLEKMAELEKEIIEDDIPEEVLTRTKPGDVWQLGEHLLVCGDSTEKATLEKIMRGGQRADMVFTDPPYGMKKEKDGVANDNLNYDDLLEFNKKWIPLTFEFLKKNGSWYCWGIDEPLMDIYSEILRPMKKRKGEDKLTFRNLITWDKGNGQGQLAPGKRMYATADEKCLFVMMGRQTYGETEEDYWDGFEPIRTALVKLIKTDLNLSTAEVEKFAGASTVSHWFAKSQWEFPNDERFHTMCENLLRANRISREGIREEYDRIREEYDRIREEYDRIREEWYSTRAYFDNTHDNMNNVWHFNRVAGGSEERDSAGGHATPKPIALCSRAIKTSSREGEIVLDVFGGSGSTMIACEQLGRKARLVELDPHWCDVIVTRWETFTGKKAEKIKD